MGRVSFQREFSLQRETRVRISDREKNLPSTETTGQPCSFLLFLSFFLFFRCHRFLISRFVNLGFSNFIHRLIILAIFPLFLSLSEFYIFWFVSEWRDFWIAPLSCFLSCSIGSNIVRMKFSQTLLPAYKNTTEEKRGKKEERRAYAYNKIESTRYEIRVRPKVNTRVRRRTIRFRLFSRHPSRVFTRIVVGGGDDGAHDSIRPRYCWLRLT